MPLIWGTPGIGKTELVEAVGRKLQREVLTVHAVTFEPTDLRGLPNIKDNKTCWSIPDFLPKIGTSGILFLDELNRAATSTQNALLRLMREKKIGDYCLPDTWDIVAACNPSKSSSGVMQTSSAMNNRVMHLFMDADLDEWCNWHLKADLNAMVRAFVRFRPEHFNKFDKSALAFPSPRSWESVSKISSRHPVQQVALGMYGGLVGHGVAVEFLAFEKIYNNLPDIDDILLRPTTAKVPTDIAAKYAVACALGRKATPTNIGSIVQYTARMDREFNVMCMVDALGLENGINKTPEYSMWIADNSSVSV